MIERKYNVCASVLLNNAEYLAYIYSIEMITQKELKINNSKNHYIHMCKKKILVTR